LRSSPQSTPQPGQFMRSMSAPILADTIRLVGTF
jgi:hypothetical protein